MIGANSNEATLCAWLAAGDRGDVEVFDQYLHPDVIVHAPLGLSTAGVDAEKAVWADAKSAIPDIRHDVREVVSEESRAVARVVVTGTPQGEFAGLPSSGESFSIDQVVFAHFRDGLIVEAWEIADIGSLLRQLDGK